MERLRKIFNKSLFQIFNYGRSVVLLDIDFEVENQVNILRIVKQLSNLIHERNIELSQAKELLYEGKIDYNGKAGINWKALED